MSYTKQQRQLYQNIKDEAIEQGETLEEAEASARDFLYYTRREEREANADRDDRSSNGWHIKEVETMKQATIKQAQALGFKVTDRLEQYVSDYTLVTNQDTFEETERWSTKKVYFWNVTFPSDYPNQKPHAVYDDTRLLALIKQYNNRIEDARRDAEFSQHTIEGMAQLNEMFLQNKPKS